MRDDNPILASLKPVIRGARDVALDESRLLDVADGLAGADLGWPVFSNLPGAPPEDRADFFFVTASINFAFTDFETGEVFRVEDGGRLLHDADAMSACLRWAYEEGQPILDGSWLGQLTPRRLGRIFTGTCPIPMLDERCRNLAAVGRVLDDRFGGRFHRFLASLSPCAYANGRGLLERLPEEFSAFRDSRPYRGAQILFLKRAQLLLWQLHCHFREDQFFQLEDVQELTIFADYIVPMALSLLGVLRYSEPLRHAIRNRQLLPEGCEQEVEIRAFSIWACHLLTRAINTRRGASDQIIEPLLDAYLWFHYHESAQLHHLTRTTSY